MKKRKITSFGRLSAIVMAFFIAFSGTSGCFLQSAEAAPSASVVRSEEELKGMLSVATLVGSDWKNDIRLRDWLTQRDLKASEYAEKNGLEGTYNTSGGLGNYSASGIPAEWLSNVLYQGDILRSDSFSGFTAVYNGGADAAVIDAGINVIDVKLTPKSDLSIKDSGAETDISTWESIPGFASRFMLPHGNGAEELDLKNKKSYRTKLYIVGMRDGLLSKGSMYKKGNVLDYAAFLSCIGADHNAANLASYIAYLKIFQNILYGGNGFINGWAAGWNSSDSSDDSDSHSSDSGSKVDGRVIMIYLDGADLTESAALNLYTMLTESAKGSIGSGNRIIIMTGGSKDNWTRNDGQTVEKYLYNLNGEQQPSLVSTLGKINQLWELREGKLTLLENGFNDGGYMTQGSNLAAFIKSVKSRYPDASKYDLIMWDHGGGPEGGFGLDKRRANDQAMSLVDMTNAIKDSGVIFDFIAFDACLMSNAEVALALSPYSEYLILSEQEFPGKGLYYGYENLISELIKDHNVDTPKYAKSIIESAIQSYSSDDDKEDAILALIDSSKIRGEFSDALTGFAEALTKAIKDNDQDTLDAILKIRKVYSYIEVRSNNAYTRDLIDVQGLCDALMTNYDGWLKTGNPALYAACEKLKKAANNTILYYLVAVRDETKNGSRDFALGTEPTGLSVYFPTFSMSVTPIGADEGNVDQVLDLISAYKSSEKLDPYGKSLAAYGVWLKVGKMLGYDSFWADIPNKEGEKGDSEAFDNVWNQKEIWSIKDLMEASGLTKQEVDDLIWAQVSDRIRKNNIIVEDIGDGQAQKKLTVTDAGPDIVDHVDAKVYVTEKDAAGNPVRDDKGKPVYVSLGSSSMYSSSPSREGRNSFITIDRYDNQWLVLDGKVVSYYDTEIRAIDGVNYRMGIIPVAYWKEARKGDETDSTLKAAIDNNKVMIGVLEVRFKASGATFESTGTVTDFRKVNDSSIAISGYNIGNKEIYELLAGFDDGNDSNSLRSIGVIQSKGNNMSTVRFATIDTLEVEYSIVDEYESRYLLNEDYFPNDPRNLDDFAYALSDEDKEAAVAAPIATKYTADQSGLDGNYSDRDVKSVNANAGSTGSASDDTSDDTSNDAAAAPALVTAGAAAVTDAVPDGSTDTPVTDTTESAQPNNGVSDSAIPADADPIQADTDAAGITPSPDPEAAGTAGDPSEDVPAQSTEAAAETPGAAEAPESSEAPEAAEAPESSEAPEAAETPETAETPDATENNDEADVPEENGDTQDDGETDDSDQSDESEGSDD